MNKYIVTIIFATTVSLGWAQYSPYIVAVDEYVPAPGQFVNQLPAFEDGDDAASMAQKCTEAIANDAGGLVTLGAWGGYITFHFDHPIVNLPDQPDLYIAGNGFEGNSEPGIVCVSQDRNRNGLPDDDWYELQGSADVDSTNVTYGYSITYCLTAPLQDIPWNDNQGQEGTIQRNSFHQQEYYPLWLPTSHTYSGTCLPPNATDTYENGANWTLESLRYGYVDNASNKDTARCSFDIGWAVEPLTRQKVVLASIDFVRVYTAINQQAGWLGETSTEVSGACDLHPDAVLSVPVTSPDAIEPLPKYDLQGRPIKSNQSFQIFINQQQKSIQL